MKQNILIAALLAGMLALAGCGGGSSSATGSGNTGNTGSTSGPVTLTETGLTNTGDEPRVIRVLKDTPFDTGTGKITCPVAECVITVSAQEGTPVVTQTGGATFAETQVMGAGSVSQTSGGDTGPLGKTTIMKAIEGGKILGLSLTNVAAMDGNNNSAKNMFTVDGKKTDLWLWADGLTGNDAAEKATSAKAAPTYIFWGFWEESRVNKLPSDKSTVGRFWGGKNAYGKKPEGKSIATYTTRVASGYKHTAAGNWTILAPIEIELMADFDRGKIEGTIPYTPNSGTKGRVNLDDVKLEATIGSDDFMGTAKFAASGTTKQSGTVNGQFFGSQTGPKSDAPREIVDTQPSHVAGGFEVKRDKDGTDQTALTVSGSFGGDCTNNCQ